MTKQLMRLILITAIFCLTLVPVHSVTAGMSKQAKPKLTYKGKKDVVSQFANGKKVTKINHYVLTMGEGNPINIYVTDDYNNEYGKGYAYTEIDKMIESIQKFRDEKPYKQPKSALNIFFYTNESKTPLPTDYQAALGAWSSNQGEGVPTEMVVNGSTMPYDFRTSLQHELYHFFDYQSFINQNDDTFQKYWGKGWQFWLLEGGAEYSSYFFYTYPKNTKNQLRKDLVQNNKESILAYAKAQGGNKQNLLYDTELDSFNDIYKASSNNYGITLSLFWYLVNQYGYEKVYDYARYIADTYSNQNNITTADKNKTAKKFFGKTEEDVLKDWLVYFNYFDGELGHYEEITTGTANYALSLEDPFVPESIRDFVKTNLDTEGFHFILNIEEWIEGRDYTQAHNFRDNMTYTFELYAEGYESVEAQASGAFFTDLFFENGDRVHAYHFSVKSEEMSKLVKGVQYSIKPINNHPTYKWIIPETITLKY